MCVRWCGEVPKELRLVKLFGEFTAPYVVDSPNNRLGILVVWGIDRNTSGQGPNQWNRTRLFGGLSVCAGDGVARPQGEAEVEDWPRLLGCPGTARFHL